MSSSEANRLPTKARPRSACDNVTERVSEYVTSHNEQRALGVKVWQEEAGGMAANFWTSSHWYIPRAASAGCARAAASASAMQCVCG
jgi:hypothetical protein